MSRWTTSIRLRVESDCSGKQSGRAGGASRLALTGQYFTNFDTARGRCLVPLLLGIDCFVAVFSSRKRLSEHRTNGIAMYASHVLIHFCQAPDETAAGAKTGAVDSIVLQDLKDHFEARPRPSRRDVEGFLFKS